MQCLWTTKHMKQVNAGVHVGDDLPGCDGPSGQWNTSAHSVAFACRRFQPRVKTRFARVLLTLLLSRTEALGRELTQHEQAPQEHVSDGIRVGVVLQRLEESALEQSLLLNSETSDKMGRFPCRTQVHSHWTLEHSSAPGQRLQETRQRQLDGPQ